jgi:acyl-CoA dehydrogenase
VDRCQASEQDKNKNKNKGGASEDGPRSGFDILLLMVGGGVLLADMAVARDAARGLTQRAIEVLMRGERGTMEASTAKVFSTEALGRVVDAAVQIHGGMGYMREVGIETTFRDARIVRIYEGTSEIQRNIIAGLLLKD